MPQYMLLIYNPADAGDPTLEQMQAGHNWMGRS